MSRWLKVPPHSTPLSAPFHHHQPRAPRLPNQSYPIHLTPASIPKPYRQGFPESVAPQYAQYMGWRGVQYFFGGAISVFTTKCLLGALGVAGRHSVGWRLALCLCAPCCASFAVCCVMGSWRHALCVSVAA